MILWRRRSENEGCPKRRKKGNEHECPQMGHSADPSRGKWAPVANCSKNEMFGAQMNSMTVSDTPKIN